MAHEFVVRQNVRVRAVLVFRVGGVGGALGDEAVEFFEAHFVFFGFDLVLSQKHLIYRVADDSQNSIIFFLKKSFSLLKAVVNQKTTSGVSGGTGKMTPFFSYRSTTPSPARTLVSSKCT